MGKKRVATIDLSQKEKGKKTKKAKAIVKSGKAHGRIADMNAVMIEEMKKREKPEKAESLKKGSSIGKTPLKTGVKKKTAGLLPKTRRPSKTVRSKRYRELKKLAKTGQNYSLNQAVKLLKKMANAKFDESVELHLIVSQKGNLTKEIKTEKKAPLVHLKIGKISLPEKKITEEVQTIIRKINANRIKKAVLTTTMGPGIKIDLP